MAYSKPLPVADPDSAPYWEGCRRHELLLQHCAGCGQVRFPPAGSCPHCGGDRAEWIEASGRGTVYSWIVVERPIPPQVYGDDVPYVVALIELDEGVRLPTNLIDCAPAEIVGGLAVEVVFDDVTDEITLPKFRPLRRP